MLIVEVARDVLAQLEVIVVILSPIVIADSHILKIGVIKDATQQHAIR